MAAVFRARDSEKNGDAKKLDLPRKNKSTKGRNLEKPVTYLSQKSVNQAAESARKMKKMKTEAPQHVIQYPEEVEEFNTFEEFEKHFEDQQKEALKAGQRPTFLWAELKKSSKYFGQTKGKFQVCAQDHEYCLKGGVGGRYRTQDVNLFAKVGDDFVQLT